MMIFATGSANSFAQFMTVLIVFLVVLALTAWTTRFIANYQKTMGAGSNIEVMESVHVHAGKYIQIIRIGNKYMAVAVCKETITPICEVDESQIALKDAGSDRSPDFKALLQMALHKETKE